MFDRTTQDNDLRRAMNACLPGLENKPGFEREVLKRARGEIKVKKKLSVGLVFILILVLAAVAALAQALSQLVRVLFHTGDYLAHESLSLFQPSVQITFQRVLPVRQGLKAHL